MENENSFQTFTVSRSSGSMTIELKSAGFRKRAMRFLIGGIFVTALGFSPIIIFHYAPEMATGALAFLVYLKFLRWIGFIMIFAGIMILVRTIIMSRKPVVIDPGIRNLDLRGTMIPFDNIQNIVKNDGAMGLVSVVLEPKTGRKRMLLAVVVSEDEMASFDNLVAEMKGMVGLSN